MLLVMVRHDPWSEIAEMVGEKGASTRGISEAPREHAPDTNAAKTTMRGNVGRRKVSKFYRTAVRQISTRRP